MTKGFLINKKLIGFIIVVKDRKDRVNVINFLIDRPFQNQGYGSCLLRKTIQEIRQDPNIQSIVLNVHIKNKHAIRVYEKQGFHIQKKIDNYYENGKSAFLMKLKL
jgi:ribosomal protein S18 acetylase RimI-like enzyme